MLKPSPLSNEFKKLVKLIFSISLAVFLFVLFFQPFDLDSFIFNSKLLIISGLSGITFVLLVILLQILPSVFPKTFSIQEWETEPDYLTGALFIIFNATAYAFYLRYVGDLYITMYVMFKIVLISIFPVVILWVHYKLRWLNMQLERQSEKSDKLLTIIDENKELQESKIIELFSENKSEKLQLKLEEIALIKSADNYVEVIYSENGQFKKNLIRNTLRNIESQLSIVQDFIRCHRTCIINIRHVEKLAKHYNAYTLTIKGYSDPVPVSRQYLLKVKEALGIT